MKYKFLITINIIISSMDNKQVIGLLIPILLDLIRLNKI